MTQIRSGDLIAERWEVKRRLGEGRFAEVFEVLDVHAKGDDMVRASVGVGLDVLVLHGCYRLS